MKQLLMGVVMLWNNLLLADGLSQVISGYDFLSPEMQAIQDDDFLNPGMSAVEDGHALFVAADEEGRACADCHGESADKLDQQKIAAYPLYSSRYEKMLTLQEQVHACWTDNLDRFPLLYDDPKLLKLETFVRYKARGQPINVKKDPRIEAMYTLGKQLYEQRFGQVGMTCHQCHITYQGQYLRGSKLTQGQTNGFPVYRFKSDRLTSLHRRFNECFVQLRATPYEVGSEEYRALEYYMATLSNGLTVETPGVRH